MTQNARFIQFLSLLLFDELNENPTFLNSAVWKLYLLVKRICEIVCSARLSEDQVNELHDVVRKYLDIRIKLKNTDSGMCYAWTFFCWELFTRDKCYTVFLFPTMLSFSYINAFHNLHIRTDAEKPYSFSYLFGT